MKKRLNLKELELQLPAIDERNTKILLGGSDYSILDECAGVGCGCQLIKDYVLTNEHNDYGGLNYENDGSLDGMFDNDGSNDADGNIGSTGSTGTVTSSGISISSSLGDGFNIDNSNVSLTLTNGNTAFNSQFEGIISSNSVIANLFEAITVGDNLLLIDINNIFNPSTGATTNDSNIANGYQTITFDTSLVGPNGMVEISGLDNIGINHSDLTPMESLVALLAHEGYHAASNMAIHLAETNASTAVGQRDWLINNGYSEFVNIYFTTTISGGIETVTANDHITITANEHAYMSSSNFTIVQDAINEFRADYAQAIETKNNFESAIQQIEANLQGENPNDPESHFNALNNLLNVTSNEYRDFMERYSFYF